MKNSKLIIIAYIIFLIAGIGIFVTGSWILVSTLQFSAKSLTSDGRVVDLIARESGDSNSNNHNVLWHPVVEFTTSDGNVIRFESNAGSSPSMYGRDQEVKVIYIPGQPDKARINSVMELWFTPSMLITFGAIFSIVGIGIGATNLSKKKKEEWLAVNGIPLRTEVKYIGHDTSMSVNSTHPYRIVSQYNDTIKRKVYIFESEPIWLDPSGFIGDNQITVLVDPTNYNRYSVDLSFLPESGS